MFITYLFMIIHSHHQLKSSESRCISRERSQNRRSKTSEITLPSVCLVHVLERIQPRLVFWMHQVVSHDSLLDNVYWVCCDPKHCCRQSACPEVCHDLVHACLFFKVVVEDIVRTPPEQKVCTENHCCEKTFV